MKAEPSGEEIILQMILDRIKSDREAFRAYCEGVDRVRMQFGLKPVYKDHLVELEQKLAAYENTQK